MNEDKREQLIKLAEEVGFDGSKLQAFLMLCVAREDRDAEEFYYLWMCEFKRWFKTEHGIDVCAAPIYHEDVYSWYILRNFEWVDGGSNFTSEEDFTSEDEALEAGLIKACEIVKAEKGCV